MTHARSFTTRNRAKRSAEQQAHESPGTWFAVAFYEGRWHVDRHPEWRVRERPEEFSCAVHSVNGQLVGREGTAR